MVIVFYRAIFSVVAAAVVQQHEVETKISNGPNEPHFGHCLPAKQLTFGLAPSVAAASALLSVMETILECVESDSNTPAL
jgi:hypothetical protein